MEDKNIKAYLDMLKEQLNKNRTGDIIKPEIGTPGHIDWGSRKLISDSIPKTTDINNGSYFTLPEFVYRPVDPLIFYKSDVIGSLLMRLIENGQVPNALKVNMEIDFESILSFKESILNNESYLYPTYSDNLERPKRKSKNKLGKPKPSYTNLNKSRY